MFPIAGKTAGIIEINDKKQKWALRKIKIIVQGWGVEVYYDFMVLL
jgi:hypothetical protein